MDTVPYELFIKRTVQLLPSCCLYILELLPGTGEIPASATHDRAYRLSHPLTLRHTLFHYHQDKIRMPDTSCVVSDGEGSFYDRKPTVEFKPPTPDWGYLAQVNEKFRSVLTWEVERIVGEPAHMPMFRCTPGRPIASYDWMCGTGG